MNLISDGYKKQLQAVHNRKLATWKSKVKKYKPVQDFIAQYNPTTLLDYGCGKGYWLAQLKEDYDDIAFEGYDPGVRQFENLPDRKFDCLISNDVIEHIEPDYLDTTLKAMESYFTKSAYLLIACYPAKKRLPDGRNAHLVIENPDWWIEKIKNIFTESKIVDTATHDVEPGKTEIKIVLEK